MTLTITKSEDEQRQLSLTVEVPEADVQKSMRKQAKKVAGRYNIPGFRKGKAPYKVIAAQFGEEALRADAADTMIDEIFRAVLEQEELNPYGQPSLDNIEIDPVVKYTFRIPLEPVIELGDYRSLRKEIAEVDIQDAAVDEAILGLKEQNAIVAQVERPAAEGDVVKIQGTGVLEADGDEEGEKLFDESRPEGLEVILNDSFFKGAGVQENIIGMSAGEIKDFKITFPEDDEGEEDGLAGKTADFNITVLEVMSRELPDEDELPDLISGDGAEGIDSPEALRTRLRENLEAEAKQQAQNDLFDGLIDDLHKDAKLVYPPASVDMQIDEMMQGQKQQMSQYGLKWEDYLMMTQSTDESMRETMREEATKQVERNLVMGQFIEEEKLQVTPEELATAADDRIEEMYKDTKIIDPANLAEASADEVDGDEKAMTAEDLAEQKDKMKEFLVGDYGMQMMGNEILADKLNDRVKAIYAGTAPKLEDLVEPEAEEAKADAE